MVKSNTNSKSTSGQVIWPRYVSVLVGALALGESLIKLSDHFPVLNNLLGHTSVSVLFGCTGAVVSYFASRKEK